MQTEFKTAPSMTMNASLSQLPILKHFDQNQISTKIDNFKKGEWTIFTVLKLMLLGAVGYLSWVYVLPPIFQAVGQLLAVAATGVMCIFLILLAPVIFKGLRVLTRSIHKAVINSDPFLELDTQRDKMVQNQQVFRASKGKILALKSDMQVEAANSEAEANKLQAKILSIQSKASQLKNDLDEMVKKGGAEARNSDEYVNGNAELAKLLSESARVSSKLAQSKDFIQKYGSRAAIMKKFSQKMVMVETSMDIKIADFDATIEMLKKDYEFGQKSRVATEAAKSAMLFTKGWELDYALDVVTSTIASDIAITAGNLRDIDSLSQYSLDNDELYANLNTLADNIKVGTDVIPSSKIYNNPDYQLTQTDKIKSNGFDNIFD
jgi:hypothetical protein